MQFESHLKSQSILSLKTFELRFAYINTSVRAFASSYWGWLSLIIESAHILVPSALVTVVGTYFQKAAVANQFSYYTYSVPSFS